MIFLIEYDRRKGLINLTTFDDSERSNAENRRLQIELDLNRRGLGCEVVLLEAVSEEALRRTHRRYFESLRTLTASGSDAVASVDKR